MEIQGSNFILEEFFGFWSNLRNLPFSEDKLEHIGNIYNASPASACFLLCILFMILCFVAGEFTGNLSQVDKLWSITPVVYMWILYTHPRVDKSPRLLLMLGLVQLWSLRLTYNFTRRGGYTWPPWSGEEDYRWEYVRKFWFMNYKLLRLLFHIGFICVYQHILLLALVFPALMASKVQPVQPLNGIDMIGSFLFLTLLITETCADQQQWNFQTEKYTLKNAGKELVPPYDVGFLRSGLWKYSAHPNYASEQGMWIVFYLFSVAACGYHQFTFIGGLNLVFLFSPSVDLSEGITREKYSRYSTYLLETPRFASIYILAPLFAFIAASPYLI